MIQKQDVLNELNEWLNNRIIELKFPNLLKGKVIEKPTEIIIEDIKIKQVAWNIDRDRGAHGDEILYYVFDLKNIGPLCILNEECGVEPFVGKFTCYFEDYETLIVDDISYIGDETARRVEIFFKDIDINLPLFNHPPKIFNDYVLQESKKEKEYVKNIISSYYNIKLESIEFSGGEILLYTDRKIALSTNTHDFIRMEQEVNVLKEV